MSPLLSGVFCQCRTEDSSDPGGGVEGAGGASSSSFTASLLTRERPLSVEITGSCDDSCEPSYPCELCGGPEQDHRLKVLFQVLDVNGDGGICVNDLSIGLKKLGVHRTELELMVSVRVHISI